MNLIAKIDLKRDLGTKKVFFACRRWYRGTPLYCYMSVRERHVGVGLSLVMPFDTIINNDVKGSR